mmetsp:Transcript_11887/g.26487  ORF Transcript_11887/g.26487 Transcript_11887/m.26487 type:complete len:517 (+) Transcript_11887:71-1621(+)
MLATVEDEVVVLQAIYGDEAVRGSQPLAGVAAEYRIEVDLQPRVEQGAALVSLTLLVDLPAGYPHEAAPIVTIDRSRGLLDAALARLAGVAQQAVRRYSLQEDGCISQVMADISDALDAANEASECCICLLECPPGPESLRAPCDHIFHRTCIAHWAQLKAEDAEREASESSSSTVAQRDALERDLSDTVAKQCELEDRCSALQERVDALSRILTESKARQLALATNENPADVDLKGLDEDLLEEPADAWEKRFQKLKVQLQKEHEAERRVQHRASELRKQLEALATELSLQAEELASASLPCPVCRCPMSRTLFSSAVCEVAVGPGPGTSEASVTRLPSDMQSRVRKLQDDNAKVLARRAEKERLAKEAEEALARSAAAETAGEGDHVASCPDAALEPERSSKTAAGLSLGGKGKSRGRHSQDHFVHSEAPVGRGVRGHGEHSGNGYIARAQNAASSKSGHSEWQEWKSASGWHSAGEWQTWSDTQYAEWDEWDAGAGRSGGGGGRGRWNRAAKS